MWELSHFGTVAFSCNFQGCGKSVRDVVRKVTFNQSKLCRMKREEPPEDWLFSAALAFAREEREAFVERAAGGDAELLANVRMLLEAYELEGGDDVGATLLDEPRAREQWAEEVEEPGTRIGHFTLISIYDISTFFFTRKQGQSQNNGEIK